ncbi:MAG: Fic family protein [Hyphomonadaceae bacterium]|nr:Fic family protein [Hyphomonadaceae bacterium]
MRIPQHPPALEPIGQKLANGDPQRFLELLAKRNIIDAKGRYLHWDEFRRKPTPQGTTAEEAWFATRSARAAAAQPVPLLDVRGRLFSFCEPPALRAMLRYVDLNAGGVLGTEQNSLSPADGSRYFTRSLAEEPFTSSFIEGAATTRQRAKQLIFEQRKPRTRDELMVLNNYRGMLFVKEMLAQPLSVETILETHRIITDGTLDDLEQAGRLRASDDIQVVDDSSNEILHQPPPHGELLTRLQKVCDFANASENPEHFVHPIVRAIILHFAVGYEHPFVDGNGRTARALFYWSALRAGYWLIEYVSISSVIAQAKTAYGQAYLKTETDAGDLTYFLLNQASVLQTAIDRLLRYAERRKAEVATFQRTVLADEGSEFNRRQSALLNDAAKGRVLSTTIKEHETRHKVSRLTARNDLEELVALRLLKKRKSGRQNVYVPVPDLASKLGGRKA